LILGSAQIDLDDYDFNICLDYDSYCIGWTVDSTKTNITIAVSAPTTGWAAFGISPSGSMPLSDIALFWVDEIDGTVFLQDRYTTSTRSEGPLLDINQNLILIAGEQINGKTNIVFQRSIRPCDTDTTGQDYPIVTGTSRVLYAYSTDDSDPSMDQYNAINPELSEISVSYHGQNRGARSVNLLDGTDLNVDLEGDTQTVELTVDGYTIPSAKTTYYDTYYTLPVSGSDKYHITKFEPIVEEGNELHVHHMVIYFCSQSEQDCNTAAYAWAIGGEGMTFPANIGLEMSLDYLYYVRMQIHYDNPDQLAGVIDSSGLRIYYTSTLRDNEAGLMEFGLSLGAWQFIPAGMDQAINTAYCMAGCTNATGALPETGVYAFSAFLHAHVLGVALQLRHIRDGVELAPLAVNWAYDFDYQQSLPLSEHRQVLPGDEFILDCYYDSTESDSITYGGESTEEEMCQAYVYVYPRPQLGDCISRFEDAQFELWLGGASQAGYLTGTSDNLEYNLGGNPFTYGGLTWQNGEEFYNFLWQETGLPELSTRYQACFDIDGNRLTPEESFEIPTGFTPYTTTETCTNIDAPVGQLGDYNTLAPTAATVSPTGAPSESPVSTSSTESGTTSDTLCGEVTSDGTSTDVSVKVCVDLEDDTVLITISGPEDVWFGVGFDAVNMADAYAIIVHGSDMNEYNEFILTQYSLGSAAPWDGSDGLLSVDRTVDNGIITATVKRDRLSSESGVYSFPNTPTSINVIFGKGTQKVYGGGMGGHSAVYVALELAKVDAGDDGNMINFGILAFIVNIIINFVLM